VNSFHATADLVRKIGLLALMGFTVVLLSGPILAVVSVLLSLVLVLLPFVLVGLAVWLPIRYLSGGRQALAGDLHGVGHDLGRVGHGVGYRLGQALRFPLHVLNETAAAAWHVARGTLRFVWNTTRFAAEVSLVGLTGGLIGAVIGVISGMHNHDLGVALPMNILAGGAIGLATGLVLSLWERRSATPTPQKALS
jgi:hypothetical protein